MKSFYWLGLAGCSEHAGCSNEWNAACARFRISPLLFSQAPRRKKGSAVARAQSLALRGILDSGSQRKSCAATKKVSTAHRARARICVSSFQTGNEEYI